MPELNPLNRRDFLKLGGLAAASLGTMPIFSRPSLQAAPGSPNVFIFVFDTMSARHMSFTNYPRPTTPHLDRFMQSATVFHNHQASALYTTPATASLLTGTHVLTHRSFQLGDLARRSYDEANLFSLFTNLGYHTLAYTHNPMAGVLLDQFASALSSYKPREELFLTRSPLLARLASEDFNAALQANTRILDTKEGLTNSLLLSRLLESLQDIESPRMASYKAQFPIGLPGFDKGDIFFVLEEAIDWIASALTSNPTPLLGYFHLLPPHSPYHPPSDFYRRFSFGDYEPPEKPRHLFVERDWSTKELRELRVRYDEYYLYVDSEFNRLISMLEQDGILDDSWIIFTSDHGELFERGLWGHTNLTLYQPLIHVPLVIKAPGQSDRLDVLQPTSVIDVLPTLQHVLGEPPVDFTQGQILPPYAPTPSNPERSIFAFNPKRSRRKALIENGIFSHTKGTFKLIYSFGYPELNGQPLIELFNLAEDPEEMRNLALDLPATAEQMLHEILLHIQTHDSPWIPGQGA